MKIIVCVDDNQGMLFHNRRQSRDKNILTDLKKLEQKIWIHSFSEKLFQDHLEMVTVSDTFLEEAGENEFCFVEHVCLQPYVDRIQEVWLYKWNRKYPADVYLDLDIKQWYMQESRELEGNSHDRITLEIYRKG